MLTIKFIANARLPYIVADENGEVYAECRDRVCAESIVECIDGVDADGNDVSAPDGWGEIEPDDSMDGDHTSALASAGWGTDEDYYEGY